jgi:TonB family protein
VARVSVVSAVALAAMGWSGPLRASDPASTEAPIRAEKAPDERRRALVAPRALDVPPPDYPEGGQGDALVVVELTVERDGRVTDPSVVSGVEPFASAALAAVDRWRFEPARRGEEPVAARIRIELRFTEAKSEPPSREDSRTAPRTEPEGTDAASDTDTPAVAEVTVKGIRPAAPKMTFRRAEVREIPGTFGDPFRAIEVMPGVTPIVSGIPYFFVRGAPPGNVGYFLDGIRVPLLYHFALGPSVIHPGIVERVDLYSGGYPARYGRFAGGVVAAETTPPADSFHGEGNVRIFDAGALMEGPVLGSGTLLVAGRYSYTAGILSLVAPEVTLAYWDYQIRGTYALNRRDELGLFAFGAYDMFATENADGSSDGLSSQFHRVDARWDRRIDADTRLRTAMTFGWDRTGNAPTSDVDVSVVDHMFATRFELEHRASSRVLLRAGADAVLDRVVVGLRQEVEPQRTESRPDPAPMPDPGMMMMPPPSEPSDESDDLEILLPTRSDVALGLRGDAVVQAERGVTVTPGLRVDFYHSAGASAVGLDPRIAARFDVSPAISLEHSFGVVHQPPSFVIPIPGFELSDLRGGLQRSVQSSAGVEWRLPKEWVGTLTLYQNAFFNLTDILSFVRYGDELEDLGYRSRSLGHSYGLELVLRRPLTRTFGGYFAYTLARSERSLGRLRRPSSFDRTHVFHAAAAYDLGRRWRLGSRLTYYTGNPSSVRVGERLVADPGEPSPSPPEPEPPPPLHERAPSFFRVDVRLEKRWLVGNSGAWISFVLEVLNASLSREVVNHECDHRRCTPEEIGPVTIPSIGLEAAF